MKNYLYERVEKAIECYVINQMTIRAIAKLLGVSKSTVYVDLSERAKEVRPELLDEIINVSQKHLSERHINGGLATKIKFEKMKMEKKEEFVKSIEQLEG